MDLDDEDDDEGREGVKSTCSFGGRLEYCTGQNFLARPVEITARLGPARSCCPDFWPDLARPI